MYTTLAARSPATVYHLLKLTRHPQARSASTSDNTVLAHISQGMFFFYHPVYDCMFCILLFNSVSYVFLLLRLYILIVMYVLFCIFSFHRANWHSLATLTEVFPCFFLSCKANARV